jgi:hypothetical protein
MQPGSAERESAGNELNVPLKRWGRLKEAVLFGIIDGECTMRAIAARCWDAPPTRSQLGSLRRAARQIAAHVGRGVWKLRDGL